MTNVPPRILLNKRASHRTAQGYPWVFRSDIEQVKQLDTLEPGTLVYFCDLQDRIVATGYLNPRCQLMGRVLSIGQTYIDHDFFTARFQTAMQWRDLAFGQHDYMRLVHAESDGLPGLIVDLFGSVAVCQANSAGMEKLKPVWLPALIATLNPGAVIFKDDAPARQIEGLTDHWSVAHGTLADTAIVEINENDTRFNVDVRNGQKTGWFYDQRPHRSWIAQKAAGKHVADIFCHTGGFGVTAARHGAAHVTFVDSSAPAIALVKKNLVLNSLTTSSDFRIGKAFDVLDVLKAEHKEFDIVCVDPPAFVKSKSDLRAGLNGYAKLAYQAAFLVKPNGLLFFASCSSHPTLYDVQNAVQQGLQQAKRAGSLVYQGTADSDHPQHPLLLETGYLKALAFRIG